MVENYLEILVPALAVAGITFHLGYFIKGEHHMNALFLFRTAITLCLLLYSTEVCMYGMTPSRALVDTTTLVLAFTIPLFTSIACYRLCFHRLRGFPGPSMAALSKMWHCWQARHSRNHLVLEKLHKQYGTFVRTGNHNLFSQALRVETDWGFS
jgi:hypothetical protein